LLWKYDRSRENQSTSYIILNSNWAAFTPDGNIVVTARDGKPNPSYTVAKNERVVCVNKKGELLWEQPIPSYFEFTIPRNLGGLERIWATRMGLYRSKGLWRIESGRNGLLYLQGSLDGVSRIYVIDGN
jgi:hypothetical protein